MLARDRPEQYFSAAYDQPAETKRMKKLLYLHIGMPKTGTTAIQLSFAIARNDLHQHGVIYPGHDNDHAVLVAAFHHAGPSHFYLRNKRITSDEAIRNIEGWFNEISSTPSEVHTAVLSTEYMHSANAESLAKLDERAKQSGYELHTVCYVRHPVSAVNSAAQQALKQGDRTMDELFAKPLYMSPRESLKSSLKILGRSRIKVLNFDDAKALGTPHHFLRAIGYSGSLTDIPNERMNTTLSMQAAHLADAHTRRTRIDKGFQYSRGYLKSFKDVDFEMPAGVLEKVAHDTQDEVSWFKQEFSIELSMPKIKGNYYAMEKQAADAMLDDVVNSVGKPLRG